MSDATVVSQPAAAPVQAATAGHGWWRDPWRRPRILATVTWLYLAWSLLPVLIAFAFSFNAGRSRSSWQGFSLRWWVEDPAESLWQDPTLRSAMFHSLRLAALVMLITVPLGLAFAIGMRRWRSRTARVANFGMLFAFVVPEIILGVALLLVFTHLFSGVLHLGLQGQTIGLVTFQMAYSIIIIRARLLTIGGEYEEAAMDLGATPTQAVRRVLLPLLYPAIFAAAAVVFADSIDNFVTVRYLSSDATTEPLSVKIYGAARAAPTPAVNAAASAMLLMSLAAIVVGFVLYKLLARGQRTKATEIAIGL